MNRHSSLFQGLSVLTAFGASMLGGVACTSKDKASEPKPEAKAGPTLKNGLTEEQSQKVLAKVGDTVITVGQFADRLSAQSPYLRSRYSSPERRREFLDSMVRFELLALEARKRGLDKDPDVERVKRQTMVQQMMKESFDDRGVKLSDISDAEIQSYYDSHPDEFHKPEQRRASHILFKDKAKAEAQLKKLLAAATNNELFVKTAKEFSQDVETKQRDGDLRFFAKTPVEGDGGPPPVVRDAAFGLKKTGDLHPAVIESPQGFHVLKLTGERPAVDRSVQDARRLIQNRLWRQKREAAIEKFVAELRAKAEVKENPDLLSQVKIDVPAEPGTPGKPGGSSAGATRATGQK